MESVVRHLIDMTWFTKMASTIVKPPSKIPDLTGKFSVFLAGSIEMGKAVDWQSKIENRLKDLDAIILNPRRDDWDSSWVQSIENAQFRGQVEWELEAQEKAGMIAMYFDPETKSPISLLELGLFAQTGKMLVCCPEGFWKKGNVDVVCNRYNVEQVSTLDELISSVVNKVRKI